MDELFSAQAVTQALLQFEAALVLGLADAEIAPPEEARAVAAACETPVDDPEALLASTWESGTPLISLTETIKSRLANEEERRWVHYGATTQDAVDTAYVLLSRQALQLLEAGLTGVANGMRELVEAHRDQPQTARTFLQDARVSTFGMRVAGWLEPILGHLERMRRARSGLLLQLGGPVGDLADYGASGSEVMRAVGARLELEVPRIPWHTDRTAIRSMVHAVVGPTEALAKMATDVGFLSSSAVDEVRARPGGSSSMPAKQNPVDAVHVLATADVCRSAARMILESRPHELDRALGSWHVEWVALPTVFQTASAAVDAARRLVDTLDVDRESMSAGAGGEAPLVDPRIIDSVLDHHSRVTGGA